MKSDVWQKKIAEMIPSYGHDLIKDGELCLKLRKWTTQVLKLEEE